MKSHCVSVCLFFPSLQVLLMQESVRRIIEAEESRMGEISNILEMGLSGNNFSFSAGF